MYPKEQIRRATPITQNWIVPLLSFIALIGMFLSFHEPWRDELRDFAVAIQSNSLQDLISYSQHDGHPGLWYMLLYSISQFTTSIAVVQVINILIITFGVYIFLQYAPIRWFWKLLIIFGYFFIYEYSILFRSYALGITLLFLICELINREKIIGAALLIMVVLNANIFAFFIGGALWLVCLVAFFHTRLKALLIGSGFVLLGTIRCIKDILPPEDYGITIGYQINFDGLMGGLANVWRAYVPISELNINYWNSNFIEVFLAAPYANYLMAFGAIIVILGGLAQLQKSSIATAFFLLLIGIIVGFTGIVYPGSLRHHGHLYIIFIIALWIQAMFKDKDLKFAFPNLAIAQNWSIFQKIAQNGFFKNIFPLIFFLQILAGGIAYFIDSQNIFSRGKEVAHYIQDNQLDNRLIIGHVDSHVSTVAAFMNKGIYFPQSDRTSTFVIWDRNRFKELSEEDLVKLLSLKKKEKNGALLITSYKIKEEGLLNKYNVRLLKAFEPSVVESYFLYE